MNAPVKRSGWSASQQLDWLEEVHGISAAPATKGVGARQTQETASEGGGGYLDECTTPEDWEGVKLRELAEMGLPQVWLDVARAIGYDNFHTMWRLLDGAVELRSDSDSMIEVQMRRYRSFLRFQRNRFIEALAPFTDDLEIQARVGSELGENLSLDHINRLARRRRMAP